MINLLFAPEYLHEMGAIVKLYSDSAFMNPGRLLRKLAKTIRISFDPSLGLYPESAEGKSVYSIPLKSNGSYPIDDTSIEAIEALQKLIADPEDSYTLDLLHRPSSDRSVQRKTSSPLQPSALSAPRVPAGSVAISD